MSDRLNSEIKQALIEELDLRGKSEADIDDAAPLFGAGLGLDSLDALQLAMAIEERFGVTVPEGEAGRASVCLRRRDRRVLLRTEASARVRRRQGRRECAAPRRIAVSGVGLVSALGQWRARETFRRARAR